MTDNQLPAAIIKGLRTLATPGGRLAQGLFLAEGEHLAQEALKHQMASYLLVSRDRAARYSDLLSGDVPAYALAADVVARLSDTKTPQGIIAVCRLPRSADLGALGPRVVALCGLQDPGNVGTILRSIDAAGFTGLLMDTNSADAYSPKALRASMGSCFRVPVRRSAGFQEDLQALSGYDIIAATLSGRPFYARGPIGPKVCLLVGNEGAGLPGDIAALATHLLTLPMLGQAESLNAGVAASIMMYDFVRVGMSAATEDNV